MPQRLSSGPAFDIPPPPPPVEPVKQGPSATDVISGAADTLDILTTPVHPWSLAFGPNAEKWAAAFTLENDVVNALELMTRPQFEEDPDFDVEGRLKQDNLWDNYRDNFIGVRSEGDYLAVQTRINREEHARQVLAAAGPNGVLVSMIAGMASPTLFLPFVGPGVKGTKAVMTAAGWGLLGGLAQEVPLQLNQETRTFEESAWSVSMSTVIGGVLGGAVGYLAKPIEEVAADMAATPGVRTIQPLVDVGTAKPIAAGADIATRVDAGGLKSALGQEKEFAGQIGPVSQNLSQDISPQGRWMTAQLADGGLTLEGNADFIPTSPGGTAENRIRSSWGKVASAFTTGDDAYARYFFGKTDKTSWAQQQKAKALGIVPPRGKLSRSEFKNEVSRALDQGDTHDIPEVQEYAQYLRKNIYDPFYEAAQKAGIYAEKLNGEAGDEVVGAPTYLNRDYNVTAIAAREPEFITLLARHFANKLESEFSGKLEKFLDRAAKTKQRVEDFELPLDRAQAVREQVADELKKLRESLTPEEVDIEDFLSEARSMARDKTLPQSVRDDAKEQAKILEGIANTPDRIARRAKEKALKGRLTSLNRSRLVLEEKRQKKLARMERIEELSLASLNRAVRAGQKFLRQLESLSDEAFDKRISELRNQFAKVAETFDRGEERISKLRQDETDAGAGAALFGAEFRQLGTASRLTEISDALEAAEGMDRSVARELVQEGLDDILRRTAGLNDRRSARYDRLQAEVEKLDPKVVAAEVKKYQDDLLDRQASLMDEWRERAPGIELKAGFRPDFSKYAREVAKTVTQKIKGTNARLAGHDLLMEPKGAELARTLDIPTEEIWPFLETDVEHLVSAYVRTLAPDIEIRNKLGDYAPDMGRNLEFVKLNDEETALKEQTTERMRAAGKSEEAIQKENLRIENEYNKIRRNLEAIIGRLRHTWGIPKDPSGFAARAGRVAMNLNVLRYMNMVAFSSIPDVAMPIMKYGMMRTFKQGWGSFISDIAKGQFNRRELQLAGAALDLTLHSRAHELFDIQDLMVRGNKLEKGLEYASSKIGLVALFDVWTTAMKQVAGTAANAQLMDDIKIVMTGGKNPAKSYERLAANGLGANEVQTLWKEIQKPGGSDTVNGVLWPNTEAWDNTYGAVDLYRQALVRQVDSTIVTPGVEKPKWMDSTLVGRVLSQFQGFAASSTTKVFLAGLQKKDAQVLYGAMISLALGAASYIISAKLAGGKSEEQMEAALRDGNWGHFADEAIARSGLTGMFSNILDIMETFPGLAPYVRLGGQRTTRTGGNNFLEQVGGPSYDLISRGVATAGKVSMGQFDRSFAHNLRLMLPLQNHFLFRRLLNTIEESFPANER